MPDRQLVPLPDVLRAIADQLSDDPPTERCVVLAAALHVLAADFCLENVAVLIPTRPPTPRYPRHRTPEEHRHDLRII